MQPLTILNSKEIKQIKKMLIRQFGCAPTEDYAYVKNDKEKVFIISKDLANINWKNLIIDKVGLYFGELSEHEFRLSKEGAYLLSMAAQHQNITLKNSVKLTDEEMKEYFHGQDLLKDLGEKARFVLLQYQNDIIGCSKYKEKKILNFLPKIHRGEVII